MSKKRKYVCQVFLGIVCGLLLLYTALALYSYDLRDIGDTYPQSPHIYNWAGREGAMLAGFLYFWLGRIAYLVPFVILCVFLLLSQGMIFSWTNICWLCWSYFALMWGCTLYSFLEKFPAYSDRMPSQGGILGLFLLDNLKYYFGRYSFLILLVIGTALLFYACTLFLEQIYLTKSHESSKNKTKKEKKG